MEGMDQENTTTSSMKLENGMSSGLPMKMYLHISLTDYLLIKEFQITNDLGTNFIYISDFHCFK